MLPPYETAPVVGIHVAVITRELFPTMFEQLVEPGEYPVKRSPDTEIWEILDCAGKRKLMLALTVCAEMA